MKKTAYHHGTLKADMIDKGLLLLNKEGYEALSLRKVAALCHVSHAAPYKHFKNKDELLLAIKMQVLKEFRDVLEAAARKYPNEPKRRIVHLGKQYVKFMVDNPDYLKFIVSYRQYYRPMITVDPQFHYQSDHEETFTIFAQNAIEYIRSLNPQVKHPILDLLAMWSVVHGLAVLIANKSIAYSGNYLDLVEKILNEKLMLG